MNSLTGKARGITRGGVPLYRTVAADVRALLPELTPGRRAAAARRLQLVEGYLAFAQERHQARSTWLQTPRWRRGGRIPPAPTYAAFLRLVGPRRARCGVKTFGRWIRQYEAGGPAALVDYRGRRRGARLAVDGELFARLIAGVAAGRSIAAADRELRPIAEAEGRVWPSLRGLQQRVRAARRIMRRNPHLLREGVN